MRALALLALCLPSTVLAGNPYDKYMGSIGEVQIDGVVEVPLRLGLTGDNMPYIEVKASEDDENYWLFVLDLGGDEVVVSSAFAEKVGADVKTVNKKFFASLGKKKDEAVYGLGGKFKVTSLDELHLGEGLVALDVEARVGTMPVDAPVLGPHSVAGVAGVIGIGALGLPAAILPTEGVVRIAPADQGQAILDAVGGTILPFESAEPEIVKAWSGKQALPGFYVVVDGQMAEQPVKLHLTTTSMISHLRRSVELGEVPTQPVADVNMVHTGFQLGDLSMEPGWFMQADASTLPYPGDVVGHVGYEFLDEYDLAIDPASRQVALRRASAQQREWSVDGFIAARAKELEPEEEDAEAEAEEKSEEDVKAEQKERAGVLDDKAFFHLVAGQAEPAIADLEEAIGLDAEPCERWMLMSEAYSYAHRFDDAAVAAQKAVDRYLAWSSLSKEEREEIEEMDDEEREASGVQPQDLDACFVSPAMVAYYQLVAGENAQAIATFDEHADLDARIGVVAGVAQLLEGDTAAAQGPLRHTLNMGVRTLPGSQGVINPARIALAELYRQEGDLDTAIEHWLAAYKWLAADPFAAEQYADLVRERDGADAVVPALQAIAGNMPHNPVIHTVLANELAAAGQADESAKAYEYAKAEMDRILELNPFVADRQAAKAWMLVQHEDWASAKETAQKALELNPSSAYAHWAMMKVAEVERKMPMALKHYRLAKGHQMGHWFFATLDKPELKITLQAFKITETAVEIPEKVYFQTGSAVIDQRSDRLLTVLAQLLNEHPELLKVSIEGHTDSVGKDRDNKKLSQERSEAVMAYLIDKGVDAARLAAKGWGEEKPIASNETDEGKASNRRVEFVIVERAEAEK
jgi:outer membrane protein OmpA-like peptidoglycan-associated protein